MLVTVVTQLKIDLRIPAIISVLLVLTPIHAPWQITLI